MHLMAGLSGVAEQPDDTLELMALLERARRIVAERPAPRVLFTGPLDGTSRQRAERLRALGSHVVHVRSGIPTHRDPTYQFLRVAHKIKPHADVYRANPRLMTAARRSPFDILWVEKGLWLKPSTLRSLRSLHPEARFVSYSGDDMLNPVNQSQRYLDGIPLYDLHVTTKSYNAAELEALGASRILFLDNAYDPEVHKPVEVTAQERDELGADIGFVGFYETDRAEMMLGLARAGLTVTVRGPGWSRMSGSGHPNLRIIEGYLDDHQYPRSIAATRINLGFLRKVNRDLQTTRSIEIPACRGFLLAERTTEHQRLFREGIEAEFFEGLDELIAKCRYYLDREPARRKIAEAGYRRCVLGGYSYEGRIRQVVAEAMAIRRGDASSGRSRLSSLPELASVALSS